MAMPRSTRNPLFLGRWFQDEVIIVAIRWYVTYPLSYRQVGDMLRDRGVSVAPGPVMGWVLGYAELEKRWQGYEKPVALIWRVDETYLKVFGRWTYPSPGCGSEWQERGHLSQQARGCGSRADVLPPRVEAARKSTLDYAECLCSLAPGRAGVEGERRDSLSEDARSVKGLPQ
jgi:hypothetical protein